MSNIFNHTRLKVNIIIFLGSLICSSKSLVSAIGCHSAQTQTLLQSSKSKCEDVARSADINEIIDALSKRLKRIHIVDSGTTNLCVTDTTTTQSSSSVLGSAPANCATNQKRKPEVLTTAREKAIQERYQIQNSRNNLFYKKHKISNETDNDTNVKTSNTAIGKTDDETNQKRKPEDLLSAQQKLALARCQNSRNNIFNKKHKISNENDTESDDDKTVTVDY